MTGQTLASATVTFGSGFVAGDSIFLDIGGTTIGKSVFAGESPAVWAEHFCCYINQTFSGVWASASGAVLTITVFAAFVGIPALLFGAWIWRFSGKNIATIESAYSEYLGIAGT